GRRRPAGGGRGGWAPLAGPALPQETGPRWRPRGVGLTGACCAGAPEGSARGGGPRRPGRARPPPGPARAQDRPGGGRAARGRRAWGTPPAAVDAAPARRVGVGRVAVVLGLTGPVPGDGPALGGDGRQPSRAAP